MKKLLLALPLVLVLNPADAAPTIASTAYVGRAIDTRIPVIPAALGNRIATTTAAGHVAESTLTISALEAMAGDFSGVQMIVDRRENLTGANHTTYPTTLAVANAIAAAMNDIWVQTETDLNALRLRMDTAETNITNHGNRITAAETNITNHGNRLTTAETNITNNTTNITTLMGERVGGGTPGTVITNTGTVGSVGQLALGPLATIPAACVNAAAGCALTFRNDVFAWEVIAR